MKTLIKLLAVLALLVAYLLFWPTRVTPVVWTPPPAPALEGVYAYNEKLKGMQRLLSGVGVGPEAVAVDASGRIYTGYADGRLVQLAPNGGSYTILGTTEGRPLGLSFGPNGGIVIADARKGLLHYGAQITALATEAEGLPFGLTDDVDNTRMTKDIYFTDATHKFDFDRHLLDVIEHGANGRLLAHSMQTGETRVLMKGLHFANGVAVGPGDAYVLVNETTAYRVLRYWLKGEKAGTHEIFIDNLPGFPDNITYNGKDRFWLALATPRNELIDKTAGNIWLRKVIARLPAFLQPAPEKHGMVLGLDLDGKVIANLQYKGSDAYAPITSVREHGPWLYFGSLTENAIGRLPLNQAIPEAPPPPPGWEQPSKPMEIPLPPGR